MQSEIAIEVEGVGKRYRLGVQDEAPENLLQAMVDTLKAPFRNYRKFKSLYRFSEGEGSDSVASDVLWALRDVSFKVPRGQVMGIVGTNGAGKSTLLKILSNITPPSTGRITIRGRVNSLLEVGTGFHPELTGRENVYLNGTIMGMRKVEIDSKFDEIVEFSGVEQFLDTPVKRYSSGMRVRLAFAVASNLEPEVLIIDEVLAVGDAAFQRKCLNKMEDVSQQGRTVLFVSHNMPAVTRLCERAILLQGGRLVMDDTATAVVSHYLADGQGLRAERTWEEGKGPGDRVVRLVSMRVKNPAGQMIRDQDIRHPVGLEMVYDVFQGGRKLLPHFIVWNEGGARLFTAMETDPAWAGKPRPAGRYVTTAWIPGNLLSEGMIYVSAQMKTLEPIERHFHARQEVGFHVVDTLAPDSARGPWMGNIDGAVRPKLEWESTCSTRIAMTA